MIGTHVEAGRRRGGPVIGTHVRSLSMNYIIVIMSFCMLTLAR